MRVKWWNKKDGLHFTASGIDRVFNPDYSRWEYRLWCPITCKEILIGIEHAQS